MSDDPTVPAEPAVVGQSAVERELTQRGFILEEESPQLAEAARQIWNRWWAERQPLDYDQALARLKAVLAQPRPQASHMRLAGLTMLGTKTDMSARLGWVRPADLITLRQRLPSHHSITSMATYLAGWTRQRAEVELTDAWWILIQRPGGWAAAVGANGHHRSLLLAAAGAPIARVRLSMNCSWQGPQRVIVPGGSVKVQRCWRFGWPPRRSMAVNLKDLPPIFDKVGEFARHGFCSYRGDFAINQFGGGAIVVDEVHPLMPWIIDDTDEAIESRYRDFCARFGVTPAQDWRRAVAAWQWEL